MHSISIRQNKKQKSKKNGQKDKRTNTFELIRERNQWSYFHSTDSWVYIAWNSVFRGALPWAQLYRAPAAGDPHFLPAESRTWSVGVGQSGLQSGPVVQHWNAVCRTNSWGKNILDKSNFITWFYDEFWQNIQSQNSQYQKVYLCVWSCIQLQICRPPPACAPPFSHSLSMLCFNYSEASSRSLETYNPLSIYTWLQRSTQ